MVNDEVKYSSILISSILIGFLLRFLPSAYSKQLVTCAVGCIYVFGFCCWDGLHSLIVFLGNLFIIKFTRKHTSLASFVWCFTYLLFFRCASFFALPQPSALANAIQLILTLKLVSVAIEIHDYRDTKSGKGDDKKKSTRFQLQLEHEPSTFDIFCYSYCYPGMFTGPFYKYRTYYDYLMMDPATSATIPIKTEILSRLKQILLFAALYGLAAYFFNVNYVKSGKLYDDSFAYQVFYMVPIFFLGRMRFYSAWLLSECSFISLTFGAYDKDLNPRPGHGPTVKPSSEKQPRHYSFATIQNIDPYGCDFSPTVRLGMRNWNMGVQWWLANYVHQRWPASLNQFRIATVMSVSAYWHGIAPGFFGAFLTMVFVMMAEDLLANIIKKRLPLSWHNLYDILNWFCKMRAFEYMYMAFALLTFQDTYTYWKATYFWLHISCFIIIPMCFIFKVLFKPKKKKEESKKYE